MTDIKPDNTSDSGSAKGHDKPTQKQAAANRPAKSSRRSGFVIAVLILLLIVAALAATVWYQHRNMHEQGSALLGRAQQSASAAMAASGQAEQAVALARQQAQQIKQMRADLDDAQQHLQSLEQALQMLTDSGTDIALINDMDHLVSIAHQQLLLGGNVSNAIIALETAQAQLARANRPSLASLQQAINGDVERLRAVSTVDINRLSSRIDELGRLVESAPLLIPDDAAPTVGQPAEPAPRAPAPSAQGADPSDPWWKQGWSSVSDWSRQAWWNVRQDLGSFINVRRVDDAAALLLSPEQAGSLRDKLRLRLMTAQLALLMKQPDVWATETRAVVQLLQSRYDINSVEGHRAMRLALQLADTSIQIDLPKVANSQSAIQALRDEHARSAQAGRNGAEAQGQPADNAAASQGNAGQGASGAGNDEAGGTSQDGSASGANGADPGETQTDIQRDPASEGANDSGASESGQQPSDGADSSEAAPSDDQASATASSPGGLARIFNSLADASARVFQPGV